MDPIKVSVTPRTGRGKGAARKLRRAGEIPAVAYGNELSPQALSVSPKQLADVLKGAYGRNSVLELDVGGQDKFAAIMADYQYHPVSRDLLHVDFLKISLDKPVDVDVAFELKGRARGVVMGGELRQVYRKLPLRCLPSQIPVKISYDVTELDLGGHVGVQDLQLPEGVEVRLAPTRTVAAIVTERRRGEEKVAEEGAEAAAPAAEAPKAPKA